MKVSKRQLRQIIKEEKAKLLREQRVPDNVEISVELPSQGPAEVPVMVPYYIFTDAIEDGLTLDGVMVEVEEYISADEATENEHNWDWGTDAEKVIMDIFNQASGAMTEQAGRAAPPASYDHGDVVLKQAMDIFGAGALVDEQDGEVVVDTGAVDTDIEEMYNQWIEVWPDAMHEEGGLIYTGVMV